MNQSRAALLAIAIVIPIAMTWTVYTARPSQEQETETEKLIVIASFYPLYDFTSHVAGDRVEVSTLVPAGVEPHDWEPTTNDIAAAQSADMLIINGAGFESWVDRVEAEFVINTSEGLDPGGNAHIWLDPVLAKQQVEKIRAGLVEADPVNVDYYNENANRFSAELDSLDKFIASELSQCEKADFITFHDAFSHFAKRYGLMQHSIHGFSPEGEILPQRIEEIIELAKRLDIDTIYSEELLDSRLADTIANEIPNGRVLILSPIEGIDEAEQAAGIRYVEKMKQNVENLKEGLDCR